MSGPPRRKRIWTARDFAIHAYAGDDSPQACRRARRFLIRLNAKHQGKLFLPDEGVVREHRFYPSTLAKLEEGLFSPIASLEFRVDELEDGLDAVRDDQRAIVSQVRQNSRDIARKRSAA